MFICQECLEENYNNFAFPTSVGPCEICGKTKNCCDVPSRILKPKHPKYEIKLEYFKQSGKFYTSGSYMTTKESMLDVLEEIKTMKAESKLPGIAGNEWIIHVNADEHPHGFPMLIL